MFNVLVIKTSLPMKHPEKPNLIQLMKNIHED